MGNVYKFERPSKPKRKATPVSSSAIQDNKSIEYLTNSGDIDVSYDQMISLRRYLLSKNNTKPAAMYLSNLLAESIKRLEHMVTVPERFHTLYMEEVVAPITKKFGL